jgi:hypothetical protein
VPPAASLAGCELIVRGVASASGESLSGGWPVVRAQGGRRSTPKATPAARFRDADDARELLDSAGEDLGANYGRPASMQGPRGSYSRGSHGVPRSTSAQDPFPPPAGLDEFHMLPAVSNR